MIPEQVMRELRYIEVYTARRIRNLRVGPYTSPQRGPGFDFDEHQPYRQGDDVRRIDWNVTARMGAPYVRHTHAERELNVMLAIDVSRSMELGAANRSKKELMTFITGEELFAGDDLAMLAAKHDVIAVVPQDASELSLPSGGGYVRVRDLESGAHVDVGLSPRVRRAYAADMHTRRIALARAFYRAGIDHVFVPTDGSPVEPLLELFARRMAR